MTAEVTSLARRMVSDGGYKEEGEGPKTELVTRDLLGSGPAAAAAASAEVDLELRVPVAWDERLSPHPSAKAHVQERRLTPAPHRLHDLNLSPPSLSAATLGPTPPPPVVSAAPVVYHSACTLEKVKSALERESRLVAMSRPSPLLPNRPDGSLSPPSSSSSSTSSLAAAAAAAAAAATTSSSAKRRASEEDDGDEGGAGTAGRVMAVAACPECLLYVLVCKVDPRCPRCAAHVPINDLRKRPRIDLNFSLQSGSNRIDNDDSTKD